MSVTAKILIFVAALAVLGTLGFIIYNQSQISKQQSAIQGQVIAQKTLIDGLVASSNTYTTKTDLNNFIQQQTGALQAIQSNLASLGATITAANVVTTSSQGQVATNVGSTSTGPTNSHPTTSVVESCPSGGTVTCPDPDTYGYLNKEQDLALNEKFATLNVPFGTVGFSAWQQNPWSINILPRTYNVVSVIGTDDKQRVYVDNQFTVQANGQTYKIPITTAQTQQVYPVAKWSFWNPRLLMGVDGGFNINHVQGEFSPSLNLGIMSYGQYTTNPDWSILEVGAAYQVVNKRPALVVTPFAYNIGKQFLSPLMNNTYVGPSVGVATDGSWTIGGGVRVGF
jgi:hypothetical protein